MEQQLVFEYSRNMEFEIWVQKFLKRLLKSNILNATKAFQMCLRIRIKYRVPRVKTTFDDISIFV